MAARGAGTMDEVERARLREALDYMTYPPRSNERQSRLYALSEAVPGLIDALDAAEAGSAYWAANEAEWDSRCKRLMAERDAARVDVARLERTIRTAVVCIVDMVGLMEQGARLEPDGLRVISERLGAALAATAKEGE